MLEEHVDTIVILVIDNNCSQRPCYGQLKLKLRHSDIYYNVISLLLCFGRPPMTMDAVSGTIVAGGRALIQLNIRSLKIYWFAYWFYQNPSTAALGQTCARLPATRMVWINWIHAAGGANGSITMVVVFVGCLCSCGWTCDVTSSLYVKNGTKITLRWG